MKYPHPAYGWQCGYLAKNLTVQQLVELRDFVELQERTPGRTNRVGLPFTAMGQKKIDAINYAIAIRMAKDKGQDFQAATFNNKRR